MILVSACLLGKNCTYKGNNNYNETVIKWLEGKDYLPICPESFGGLAIPRPPAEISEDKNSKTEQVINSEGQIVSQEFWIGAQKALEIAKESGATLAILKESSPSCGVNFIYDGTFSHTKIPGQGIAARLLAQEGLKILSEKDLEI